MGHRHPARLPDEVEHGGARRLLRAELAGCRECTDAGDAEALADLAPQGIMDSLLRGYISARVPAWLRATQARLPSTVYQLAPPDEVSSWSLPTREVMRSCTVRTRRGGRMDTAPALEELALLEEERRQEVLDDLLDRITEGITD